MSKPMMVDLTELFELQKAFDDSVVAKHPDATNVLDKKYAALLVEIAECMNEWRGFKFWSTHQEPLRPNLLLEEFVDCLHFAISIAIEHGHCANLKYRVVKVHEGVTLLDMFLALFEDVCLLKNQPPEKGDQVDFVIGDLFAVGYMLGFTFEQIVEAYKTKNAENHNRQKTGY